MASQDSSSKHQRQKATTLVEAMVALLIFALLLLGFLSASLQSRKTTEGSIMNAAATSLIYGFIEQMKMLDYSTQLPTQPANTVKLRITQDTDVTLNVVYTTSVNPPSAPLTTPASNATAASVGLTALQDNVLPVLPLSTVAGISAQRLAMKVWIWIDDLPANADALEVKRITVVYTYSYNDGGGIKTVRDMEVFLRTLYSR